jgi:hypothetical protein
MFSEEKSVLYFYIILIFILLLLLLLFYKSNPNSNSNSNSIFWPNQSGNGYKTRYKSDMKVKTFEDASILLATHWKT